MLTATQPEAPTATPPKKAYRVHRSKVHGRGVFAQRLILPGERIIEYRGREISWGLAQERAEASGAPHNHTFFFSLSNGNVIDGGDHGNVARYINHSCEPNCEAIEEDHGRIFIYALHEIDEGEELNYSYPLVYEGRHTPEIKKAFACHCGAPTCTGTMLAPKPRKRRQAAKPLQAVAPVESAAPVEAPPPSAAQAIEESAEAPPPPPAAQPADTPLLVA